MKHDIVQGPSVDDLRRKYMGSRYTPLKLPEPVAEPEPTVEELKARVERLENGLRDIIKDPSQAAWKAARILNPSIG